MIDGAAEKALNISKADYAPYYYCVVTCTENGEVYSTVTKIIKNSEYVFANFNKVDEALSKIPDDLSIYTQESIDALNKIVELIDRNTSEKNQQQVDKLAEDLCEAIRRLEFKKADYSAVEKAVATIPSDLSSYTPESVAALESVLDGIDYSLDITRQEQVNEYAEQIKQATQNLKKEWWLVRLFRMIIAFFKSLVTRIAAVLFGK